MPRIARVVVPEIPHHITQRGHRREAVFFTQKHYQRYLELLVEYKVKSGLEIHAYCLMSNHVHLIAVPLQDSSFVATFKPVHMRYALELNRELGRKGFVWQGRFFSCPLDESHYWMAMRYVEMNPVRAGIVDRAKDYPWSSAAAHCGMKADDLLSGLLETTPDTSWSDWLADDEGTAKEEQLRTNTQTGRPLGDAGFIGKIETLTGRTLLPSSGGRPKKDKKNMASVT